jgi:hypothetical protein
MAKKRKKDKKEEEEYEFTPPDFDEKEFLRKEIKDTKTSLITIGLAVLFGIIAGGIAAIDRSLVAPALLVGLAGVVSLKYIYDLLKVDVSHFQKKNWLGSVGTFFFTFLAITVLLINVPFADLADPTVDKVIVWVDDGTMLHGLEYKFVDARGAYDWVLIGNETWTPLIRATDTVNITAHVADNGKLSVVEIAIGSATANYTSMTKDNDARFQYQPLSAQLQNSALIFYIRAVDSAGNSFVFNPLVTIPVA